MQVLKSVQFVKWLNF